jgi:hypothetical protein
MKNDTTQYILRMKRNLVPVLVPVLVLFLSISASAQVVINEIQVTNLSTIQDEEGDYEDWFELYNAGSTSINLSQYIVSDKEDAENDWNLPNTVLGAGQYVMIFASGKDRYGSGPIIDHLESPVYPWNWWTYFVPSSQPDASWNEIGFDDSGWGAGNGGFGFGDGDDGTDVGGGVMSVYSRTIFELEEPEDVTFMLLNIDYDDAFVCYLNGVEIARANIGTVGVEPSYDTPADGGHEALVYQGITPDNLIIDFSVFSALLQEGENVIALQVHNADVFSSDMTGSVYMVLGMASPEIQTEEAPEWMSIEFPLNHTSFGLSAGETLYLKSSDGTILDSHFVESMQSDHCVRRSTDGGSDWCFSSTPTPGTPNEGICAFEYEAAPVFSVESGEFEVPVYITLSSLNPDAQIYMSFDGSVPDESDMLYTGGFAVSGSAVVAARAYGENTLPSAVVKNSYFINEDQINLPIVSVSTDPVNLWDPVTGIHVFGPEDYDPNVPYWGANFWEDWERTAYMEYFDGAHVKQIEGPVGIKIHGGWSRVNEQKSLRLQAKGKYGFESMDYPMISDKTYIESFRGFNLRNGGNGYWEHRFHEALIERTCSNTHVDYMAYSPAIVFLNGVYWGFMEIRENLDQHYIANNHDISSSDVTVVSANYFGFHVISGDPTSFFDLHEYATTNDPNSPDYFATISSALDIENYVDYIIAQTYWCNGDWSNGYQNNTKLWHDDRPGGKWRFMLMDMDFGMGLAGNSPYDDYITQAGGDDFMTDQVWDALIQNDEFRSYFINRYADLINTEFQIDKVTTMAYDMRDEIEPIFQRHTQRWGTDGGALTGTLEWRLDWAEERVQGGRDVVQNHFGMNDQVDITLDVQPAGAGRIHISTLEPSEAEYPWTGVYFNGNPVRITVYENPGYTFSYWEANGIFSENNTTREHALNFTEDLTFTAVFEGTPVSNPIAITEMMFDPDTQNGSGDWIEIHNNTDVQVNLSYWKIKDSNYFNTFTFPEGATLEPNAYAVVASDVVAFETAYPEVTTVFGPMVFSLGNTSDEINLMKPNEDSVIGFNYTDHDSYELMCSSGCGHSRGHDINSTDYTSSAWYMECENGSPGEAFIPCTYPIMLTEINYKSGVEDADDWIELHNSTSADIDISGWVLRDGADNQYIIPSGTTLTAGEYLVIAKDLTSFNAVYPVTANVIGFSGVSLGSDGDKIKIYDAENSLQIGMMYLPQAPWSYQANGLGYTLEYIESSNAPWRYSSWFAGCELGSPARSFDPSCSPLVNVEEEKISDAPMLYPNPTTGRIFLMNKNGFYKRIEVYDIHGVRVKEQEISSAEIVEIHLSSLASGVYSVLLKKSSGFQLVRVLKE